MPDIARYSIYRFSQQIKKILGTHLLKIINYGSYARGNYQKHSDVDISPIIKNIVQYEYWADVLPFYKLESYHLIYFCLIYLQYHSNCPNLHF